jgi:hypothetical protein
MAAAREELPWTWDVEPSTPAGKEDLMSRTFAIFAGLAFCAVLSLPALGQDAESKPAPDVEVDRVDPLGDIAEDMDAATRQLDKGQADEKAKQSQRRAIAKLDQLIESLKKR